MGMDFSQVLGGDGFNAEEVDPAVELVPVPEGHYPVMIIESEEKATNDGTGTYLKLVLEITDGEFQGRKIYHNLNLVNNSEVAVKIAKAELSAICHATGVMQLITSDELHNIPFGVKVGIETRKDTGAKQNRARAFMSLEKLEETTAAGKVKPPPGAVRGKPPATPPAANKATEKATAPSGAKTTAPASSPGKVPAWAKKSSTPAKTSQELATEGLQDPEA